MLREPIDDAWFLGFKTKKRWLDSKLFWVVLAYALPGAVMLPSIGEGVSDFFLLMLAYTLASPSYLALTRLRKTVTGLFQLVGN